MKLETAKHQIDIAENIGYLIYERDKSGEKTSWKCIVDYVKSCGWEVDNWLHVRGSLQILIDNKLVKRTNNVHKEEYIRA